MKPLDFIILSYCGNSLYCSKSKSLIRLILTVESFALSLKSLTSANTKSSEVNV